MLQRGQRFEKLADPLLSHSEAASNNMDPWNPESRMNQREPPADPLDHAQFNIEKITQNIRSMKKLGEQLGTSSDTEDLRERLRQGRAVTNGLCKEATQVLRSPVSAQLRAKQDKLKKDLQRCVEDFERMSTDHRKKEREVVAAAEQRYSAKYGSAPDMSSYQESYGGGKSFGGQQSQIQVDLEGMDDVDAQIIADRNRDIQQLDRDMEDLAEVYQEVNMMVNQQGEQLDQASDNIMTSEANVSQARQHLETSEKWMNSYRKKVLILIIIIVVVIAIIVGAVAGYYCSSGRC